MKIDVEFGALSPSLAEQLKLPKRPLRYLQACADGIVTLAVGRLLTDAEAWRARRRLMRRIVFTFGKELRKR